MSAEDVVTELVDVTNEVAELVDVARPPSKGALVITGLFGLLIGGGLGYIYANRQLSSKYESLVEEEIKKTREFFEKAKDVVEEPKREGLRIVNEDKPDLESAAKSLLKYQGVEIEEDPEEELEEDEEEVEEDPEELEETEVVRNVFAQVEDPDFDIEAEMEHRSPDEPYVISEEEYRLGELGYSNTAITYYEGDNILADEDDREIPLIDPIIGEKNLERFGDGSGDPRIVFIRNERLGADFEVLKHDGKYAHEIMGLEHSDGGPRARRQMNEPRKFKGLDV